jgi:hypothetical protein
MAISVVNKTIWKNPNATTSAGLPITITIPAVTAGNTLVLCRMSPSNFSAGTGGTVLLGGSEVFNLILTKAPVRVDYILNAVGGEITLVISVNAPATLILYELTPCGPDYITFNLASAASITQAITTCSASANAIFIGCVGQGSGTETPTSNSYASVGGSWTLDTQQSAMFGTALGEFAAASLLNVTGAQAPTFTLTSGTTPNVTWSGILCAFIENVAYVPSVNRKVYLGDVTNIRVVDTSTGIISTLAITSTDSIFGTAPGAFVGLSGVAQDGLGNLYGSDSGRYAVFKVDLTNFRTRLAGLVGVTTDGGFGGVATSASLQGPNQCALDSKGNIYLVDTTIVVCINTQSTTQIILGVSIGAGCIDKVAGVQTLSPTGFVEGGVAITTCMYISNITFDINDNLIITDSGNCAVRKVDHVTGLVTTLVGIPGNGFGSPSFSGDGGLALGCGMGQVTGIAYDSLGNFVISDLNNRRLRAVNFQSTTKTLWGQSIPARCIKTIAGTGVLGSTGNGGAATSAKIGPGTALSIGQDGTIYFLDNGGSNHNDTIRKVSPAGIINTFAGFFGANNSGSGGDTIGDGGPAIYAQITPASSSGPPQILQISTWCPFIRFFNCTGSTAPTGNPRVGARW